MRRDRAIVAAIAASVALGVASGRAQETGGSAACDPASAPIPARPDAVPEPPDDPPPYGPRRGMGTTIDLGVGTVRLAPHASYDPAWVVRVEFPAFEEPDGALLGWVIEGWWVPREGDPRPLEIDPMVEIGYEIPGWIALEQRGEWVRIRWAGRSDVDGTAWVARCHLATSDPPLEFAPWESVLGSPLFFRTSTPHALRAGPGIGHERISRIVGDVHDAMLERLEIRGDWMRVRVTRPSTYCVFDRSFPVRDEGWIRWRDEAMGPWVWWFTRGC